MYDPEGQKRGKGRQIRRKRTREKKREENDMPKDEEFAAPFKIWPQKDTA